VWNGITTVVTILIVGMVLWWFVKPGSNGVKFAGGLIGDALTFFQIVT
jgi:hypothetical protein